MIAAVVFDMDGVLCTYRIERRLALLASWSSRRPDEIHAAIWGSGYEDEAERGLVSADDYLRGFGERMGYPVSAGQWVEARRAAMEPDEAVLDLAHQLGAARPVGMLTNNPLLLKRHIAEVFPAVPEIFGSRAMFSAELGRAKPDPEVFRRVASRLGVAPGEILLHGERGRVRRGELGRLPPGAVAPDKRGPPGRERSRGLRRGDLLGGDGGGVLAAVVQRAGRGDRDEHALLAAVPRAGAAVA